MYCEEHAMIKYLPKPGRLGETKERIARSEAAAIMCSTS